MTIEHDDELLTALSQGVRPAPDDAVSELLADWHADISTPLPSPAPARRRWRFARPLVTAIAAATLVFGGTAALAATAQPGSPLWSIAKIIYPERADSRAAAQAAQRLLDQTATAIAEHRYPDALAALTAARQQIALVTEADTRRRLEARWTELRALLPAALTSSPSTGTPTTAPPPGGAGAPGASPTPAPQPSPSKAGGILPPLPLPSLPLPSLPLPSLPLPSLPVPLPSLPLP